MDKFSQRWRRLCSITHRQSVRLFLNHEVPGVRSSDWDGLWLRDPEEGSAIALSPSLARSNILWIFAHELGHEFSVSQGTLVSPFWEAHISTKKSQKRWACGKTLDKGEIAANLQGAKLLVTESEWLEAESAYPTCLRAIADHLELPAVAALWRARVNKPEPLTAQIPLGTDALTELGKPVVGRGGPQSLLRRLQSDLNQRVLTCSRKDFLRCREYALNLGGGFQRRCQTVLRDAGKQPLAWRPGN